MNKEIKKLKRLDLLYNFYNLWMNEKVRLEIEVNRLTRSQLIKSVKSEIMVNEEYTKANKALIVAENYLDIIDNMIKEEDKVSLNGEK